MTDAKYAPPVDRLLTYGKPEPLDSEDWPDYLESGPGLENIPELLRMAADKALLKGNEESSEAWGPVYAVRALGQLRSETVVNPLLSLFDDDVRDDWLSDELPYPLKSLSIAFQCLQLINISHLISRLFLPTFQTTKTLRLLIACLSDQAGQ